MFNFDKCKELFTRALNELNYKTCNSHIRKLNGIDYFESYLHFIRNSIHYSRFEYTINGTCIKGKYLNEKVNKWQVAGIFKKMHEYAIKEYIDNNIQSRRLYIDGHIITNRYGVEKLGRCKFYKSKNAYNLQTITDDNGITLGFDIFSANSSESKLLTEVFDKSRLSDVTKYAKSKKYKQYFIADAGYDSKKNRIYLKKNGYTPLIWHNKRNAKCKKKLKAKKLTKNQMDHYKKRHIIENSYSWMETKIPRLSKIYDKKIDNFFNMIYIGIIVIIYGRSAFN